ncbi:MAG: LysM peptidoglycan-binding domain-containing protein [Desulfobacterota bacterium]|nr:LysM peptidoglycan-binding domain-containing protein [Thermodesulfobacteriota bacterium]
MPVRVSSLLAAIIACSLCMGAADITLVKHARRVKAPQTSEYMVKEGDTLRRILMEVYNAKEQDLPYLYRQFRIQNPNIESLDTIPLGMKIRIPIVGSVLAASEEKKRPSEVEVKEVAPNEYVIKQGEYLAKILKDIYGIPDEVIYRQYIDLVQKLNPEITNPDYIRAGHKIKLPEFRQMLVAAKQAQSESPLPASATTAGVQAQKMRHEPPVVAQNGGAPKTAESRVPDVPPVSQAGGSGKGVPHKAQDIKVVKHAVLPALKSMGGTRRDTGTYFMPVAGGTSLSINTSEIPVMELDTGRKIIFDVNGKITPEMKGFIEKTFPSFTVLTGSPKDLEDLMDKVLSVSGYFSINKDPSPLLVGSEEKVRFFGKWIVYKDFSRRNVFVINLLGDNENKTPRAIRNYASTFGIDLIEIGGKEGGNTQSKPAPLVDLKRSYPELLKTLKIPHQVGTEILLMSSGPIRIAYKAPVLLDKIILAETMPDPEMAAMLQQQSYDILNTSELQPDEVLDALGQDFEGPPLKITVAKDRSELEVPGIRIGNRIILIKRVEREIQNYLAASGMKLFVW